ncbi:hypothetical protein J2X19_001634 [Rhodoferax ferrireducens]|uniref:Uncharacterized protein n=1 Tax=Rhodoferax ferrireducens TaxID=192843 RepID=A0ABU2C6L4_9BURK|nr:hypothetical protein [Rhodoferax ferrireducens]MDR7376976.1 hypothetical protein [Rhodoferax ferrireducens]
MSTVLQTTTPSPMDSYGTLIYAIGVLLERGIGRLEKRGKTKTELLLENSRQVVSRLQSESARTAIANAFAELDPTSADALCAELHYVTSNISTGEYDSPTEEEDADAASDAKTGKDSLESFLGLKMPKWLTQLLKVLNELLSIVFKA